MLLPGPFLSRTKKELLAAFDDGQQEHESMGLFKLIIFTTREYFGLIAVAVAARRVVGRSNTNVHVKMRRYQFPKLRSVFQDLRFAIRNLRRRPSSTVLAVLTFAVGIGASSAMFSVIDTVILRPLPFPDSNELVSVYPTIPEWRGNPTLDQFWDRASFSYLEFVDWRETQTSFVSAAAVGNAMGHRSTTAPRRSGRLTSTA